MILNLFNGDSYKNSNSRGIIKVKRNRNLASVVAFILISSVCITCGVVIGFVLRVRNLAASDLNGLDDSTRTISLFSELISLDPVASNMVMNWYIMDDTCSDSECTSVNITFDTNLLRLNGDEWDKELNNEASSVPIFTWNPQESLNPKAKAPLFKTTSTLFSATDYDNTKDASLQIYPFDSYQAYVSAYAIDSNNKTVNLVRSASTGIVVGFSAASEVAKESYESDGMIYDVITFKRNMLVKSYVFIIVIGVWIITLIFVGSACKVLFGYPQPKEAFIIPMGTLFAITSLRGSMPGAPAGFGAVIDFVGILPCLAIITLTGVFLFAFLVLAKDVEGIITEDASHRRVKEKLSSDDSV